MVVFFVFFLGISVGSFLNVLIDRLPKGKSVFLDRSYCDHCEHILSPLDLLPVVSFFALSGKCRYCKSRLSWQYPFVELTTGILWLFVYIVSTHQFIEVKSFYFYLVYMLIIVSGLIAIFFTDLKYRIIPDEILVFLVASSFIFHLSTLDSKGQFINFLLTGILLSLLFFVLVIITSGKGMGMGDVKYAFFMGFVLGFPKVIPAFYISFLTGAAFSLILVLKGRKGFKSTIPFGPFLVVSTYIALFWGDSLWMLFKGVLGV